MHKTVWTFSQGNKQDWDGIQSRLESGAGVPLTKGASLIYWTHHLEKIMDFVARMSKKD